MILKNPERKPPVGWVFLGSFHNSHFLHLSQQENPGVVQSWWLPAIPFLSCLAFSWRSGFHLTHFTPVTWFLSLPFGWFRGWVSTHQKPKSLLADPKNGQPRPRPVGLFLPGSGPGFRRASGGAMGPNPTAWCERPMRPSTPGRAKRKRGRLRPGDAPPFWGSLVFVFPLYFHLVK